MSLSQSAKSRLLAWFEQNQRALPWRHSRDAYPIWISEIMLQQTTVTAVIPYFERWMRTFPTVEQLACATENEVFLHWQGLGYYRRARNIHQAAKNICQNGWPHSLEGWLALPGIGKYSAAAICSQTLGLEEALVDGNVKRVYARFCADPSTGTKLEKQAWEWADRNLVTSHPGQWNQALMELGATICAPKNPNCKNCPLSSDCLAHKTGTSQDFPAKALKPEFKKVKYQPVIHVIDLDCQPQFAVRKMDDSEWWSGLYGFPVIADLGPQHQAVELGVKLIKHTVTNHKLEISVWICRNSERLVGFEYRCPNDVADLPLSSAHRKVWKATCETLVNLQ